MAKYMSRDISWIRFNREVLEEAEKPLPLADRVLFYGITGDNMREFCMVRYPAQVDLDTPEELAQFRDALFKHYTGYVRSWRKFNKKYNLVRRAKDLGATNERELEKTFRNRIFPVLQPIGVSKARNLNLRPGTYILVTTEDRNTERERLNFIEIPAHLPRYLAIPGKTYCVDTIDTILYNLKYVFKDRKIVDATPFTILRSANVYSLADEDVDPFTQIKNTLREREKSWITLVEIGSSDKKCIKKLKGLLPMTQNTMVFTSDSPLDVGLYALKQYPRDLFTGKDQGRKIKPYRTFPSTSLFDYIRKEDRLAFHPFESYEHSMVQFMQEAADDPAVISIKISLYRVSDNSKIIEALLKAADRGKSVTVLIELKARFDEHHNMEISSILREGGVRLVYTDPTIKTHAKVCIVTRMEKRGIRTYCQVGTGNYSESNAKQYTDYSYFTADPELGYDLTRFFNVLCSDQGNFKSRKIIYAPYNMRDEISDNIDREIKRAKDGKSAEIIIKCNSFTDDKMADKIVAAATAGVKVTMIIRGACIIGMQKNIKVYSIVGQFLEHSRLYVFGTGNRAKYYLGSADLMHRNLSLRNELLIMVENPEIRERLMRHIKWYLEDNTNRRIIRSKYSYESIKPGKDHPFTAQERFLKEAKKLALN